MPQPSVAFFYESPPDRMPPYVLHDFEALQGIADVRWGSTRIGRGWRRGLGPTGWLPSRDMLRLVRRCDLVVQWFAVPSAPIVAARLCGKPSVLIAGGYDVACVPQIGYGRMLDRRTRLMGKLALNLATTILSVSRFNRAEVLRWAPRTHPEALAHGFEPDAFPLGTEKCQQVITIGALRDDYIQRKGLDTFARTSRLLPDVPFLLCGKHINASAVEHVSRLGGPNLRLSGYLPDDQLRAVLQAGAVYAQLSLHEAFGCAVAEAMLCSCTPVVTRCGALPEVVGDCGYYAEPQNPESAAEAIRRALSHPRGAEARERIVREFPLSRRQERLREHVLELVHRGSARGAARDEEKTHTAA